LASPGTEAHFAKRTVRDLELEEGEPVLVRVDFNVPLEGGRVADDARIRAALPTIELLLEKRARLVLCSHLGRPEGRDPETSLEPASDRLGELIDAPVRQAPDVVGPEVRRAVDELEPASVLVLENTRWEPGEKNDPELAPSTGPTPPPPAWPSTCTPPLPASCWNARLRRCARSSSRPGARSWWFWAEPRSPTRSP
jgi:hypothetical protein